MKRLVAVCAAVLLLLFSSAPRAEQPRAKPEDVGLDPAALSQATDLLNRFVEERKIAGAVAAVARKGRLGYLEAVGVQDLATRTRMTPQSLFRIYSMTKPVTAVAVMMLHEAGKFRLDDPVSKYLPEFARVTVTTAPDAPPRPATRAMTIEDLLLHTSGLSHRTSDLYRREKVRSRRDTMTQFLAHLVRVPLMEDPGTRYRYSEATTVLGRLVEIWSGQPFDAFLRDRVFTPLRMPDTTFVVEGAARARLATVYTAAQGGGLTPFDIEEVPFTERPALLEGAVGLVSTVPDYLRFSQMLLNKGELDGARVLQAATVERMTANGLSPAIQQARGGRMGWALANVNVALEGPQRGEYGWDGSAGTIFWIDPARELVTILMTQSVPANPDGLRQKFKTLVDQAAAAPASSPARHADVYEKSITDLQAAMTSGAASSQEITAAFLARIEAYDRQGPKLNAMIAMNPRALEIAAALDRERKEKGVRGPLHGIPIVIKDNYETADMPTTGGSMALAGFETGRDAFMVKKLRDAGAVLIGKTNLHELAAGIITISSLGGQTLNPYDPARTPGGSSGGSAAAVAASFAPAGMASDTCGSIRIPAANNNLFGLRGTAGLSSRTGIIPLSHTQDIGGPVARTVTDLAIVLDVTVGEDPADAVTTGNAARIPRFREALASGTLKGARIGLLKNLVGTAPEDEEVAGIVRKALEAMKAQGADVVEVTIPGLDETLQGSSLINVEFKTDLMQYLGQFPGAPVKSLADVLSRGEFHAALEATFKARNNTVADPETIRRAMTRRVTALALVTAALDEHKLVALAYPTLRRRPVVVEEPQRGTNCQLSASTGLPAMAVPAGFTDDGVPIGFELLGAAWSDARLVALAYAYERATSPRRPPPTTPALVAGRIPAPVTFDVTAAGPSALRMAFRYDRVSGALHWDLTGLTPGEAVLAASLHRGAPGIEGPAMARLVSPVAPAVAGSLVLAPHQRTLLEQGRVFVSVRTTGDKPRTLQGALRMPSS